MKKKFAGCLLLMFLVASAYSQPRIVFGDKLIYIVNDSVSKINRIGTYDGIGTAVFANPDTGLGCDGNMIVFDGKLYYRYADKDTDFVLATFDGSKSSIVPMQENVHYGGLPFVFRNSLLGRFYFKSADSGSVSLGDTAVAYGYKGSPIVFNDKLYFHYFDGKDKLAEYDGVNTRVFANPATGDGFAGSPLVHNSKLYFKYADTANRVHIATLSGDSIRLFDNPDTGSVTGALVVYNNALYCQYRTGDNYSKLGLFSADSIKLFSNPDTGFGIHDNGPFFVMGSNLYFVYFDTLYIKQIGKFDGNTITLFPRPDNGVGYKSDVCVFNNSFYFMYADAATKQRLAKCDGSSLVLLPNPDAGKGYQGYFVEYNSSLYFMYSTESGRSYLAKTDGSSITLLQDVYLGGKLTKKGHFTPPPIQNADIGPYTQSLSNIVEMKASNSFMDKTFTPVFYPNPAISNIMVLCPRVPAELCITDISGTICIKETLVATETMINVSRLHEGAYIISISSKEGTYSGKMIKQ